MPKVVSRVVRGRRRFIEAKKEVGEQLKRFIQSSIAPGIKKELEDIVANWKHKPTFVPVTKVTSDEIALYFEAAGPNAKYWTWTSEGTKPHIITAKRAPFLVFRRNYKPKTTTKPTWGGPGTSSCDFVKTFSVKHPGTAPREFEQFIMNKNKTRIARAIELEFRRIIRGL